MYEDTRAGDLVRMGPTQKAAAAEFSNLEETVRSKCELPTFSRRTIRPSTMVCSGEVTGHQR